MVFVYMCFLVIVKKVWIFVYICFFYIQYYVWCFLNMVWKIGNVFDIGKRAFFGGPDTGWVVTADRCASGDRNLRAGRGKRSGGWAAMVGTIGMVTGWDGGWVIINYLVVGWDGVMGSCQWIHRWNPISMTWAMVDPMRSIIANIMRV